MCYTLTVAGKACRGNTMEDGKDNKTIVGDGKELSHIGYADGTEVVYGGCSGYLSEGEYFGSGYSEDREEKFVGELAMEDAVRSGDFLLEEFTPHVNARAVRKLAHIREDTVMYFLSAAYIVIGILCLAITDHMAYALPYIVGAMMAVVGILRFIFAVRNREYVHTESNKTASSIILMALSVIILIDREWASVFIPTVWGILGLFESAHAFNHALSRIARGMNSAYYLVKGIIELALAFLLLYDPIHHLNIHIIIFGVQIIFRGAMAIPALKRRLSRR